MDVLLPHIKTNFTLHAEPGKVLVITGENGIGKSTLLRRYYEKCSDAKIVFCDQNAPDVFLDRTLLRFREILLQGHVTDPDFFDRFWKSSQLSSKEDRHLSQLSGGEKQILKLISVSAAKGDIYLLDEPGQYLDREKKLLAKEMISFLTENRKTVIVVEHDWSWLPAGSDVKELSLIEGILQERKTWTI